MKQLYIGIALSVFSATTAFAQYGPNDDLDMDGIINSQDIDDDNDGIPDTVEDAACYLLTEDFGSGPYPGPMLSGSASTEFTYYNEPAGGVFPDGLQDGEYTLAPNTNDANGDWPVIFDHSSEDGTGYAYVVNASFQPSEFYRNTVAVQTNTDHSLTAWITNANDINNQNGCLSCCGSFVLPDVTIEVRDSNTDALLGSIDTGSIPISTATDTWSNYLLTFNSGSSTSVDIIFLNNGPGGCGNDLAIDDILVSEAPSMTTCDADGDGIPNSQEVDSDGDGTNDIIDAGGTDMDNDGRVDDPTDTDMDGLADIYDPVCSETTTMSSTGNADAVETNGGFTDPGNGIGASGLGDTDFANSGNGITTVVYDLGEVVAAGTSFDFFVGSNGGGQFIQFHVTDASGNSELGYFGGANASTNGPEVQTYVAPAAVQYVRVRAFNNLLRFYGLEYTSVTTTVTDCSGTPLTLLPVELLSFNAEQTEEDVKLKWVTASEENNEYFDVEFSTDGLNWAEIGRVSGQGTTFNTTNYSFLHQNGAREADVLYYRLRQVDYDGASSYSNIAVVVVSLDGETWQLFPNPVVQGSLVNIIGEDINSLQVYSSLGQLMRIESFAKGGGITISTSGLSPGYYIVMVNGKQQLKLIIQ